MKNKTILFIIGSLFILSFLNSCKNNVLYKNTLKIPENIWQINDTLVFNINVPDTLNHYNIYITIKVKDNYLTNNLWLIINSKSPSGNGLRDLAEFYLTDQNGKWYGKKHKHLISNKFLYKANIRFPEKGIYTFKIQHGMRENDLPRVSSVGISIEKVK